MGLVCRWFAVVKFLRVIRYDIVRRLNTIIRPRVFHFWSSFRCCFVAVFALFFSFCADTYLVISISPLLHFYSSYLFFIFIQSSSLYPFISSSLLLSLFILFTSHASWVVVSDVTVMRPTSGFPSQSFGVYRVTSGLATYAAASAC